MKKKKQKIGTISGQELVLNRSGKLSRHEGIVKSGTGYHKDDKKYNRKSKKNQQLKRQLKDYRNETADFLLFFIKQESTTLLCRRRPALQDAALAALLSFYQDVVQ